MEVIESDGQCEIFPSGANSSVSPPLRGGVFDHATNQTTMAAKRITPIAIMEMRIA